MKHFITLTLISLPLFCYSQNVLLKFKDGTLKKTQILATSSSALITKEGNVSFITIDSASFETRKAVDQSLYDRLTDAGVKLKFDVVVAKEATSILLQNKAQESVDINFERFEEQRSLGKILQLLGGAALSASLYLVMKSNNDAIDAAKSTPPKNYEPKKLPIGLVIGGAASMCVGFMIDIGAGKHLKKRK